MKENDILKGWILSCNMCANNLKFRNYVKTHIVKTHDVRFCTQAKPSF